MNHVVITGPSGGQGKVFTQFIKRGFNLILIGSERTKKETELWKNIKVSRL